MVLLPWQRHLWICPDAFASRWICMHTELRVLSLPLPIVIFYRLLWRSLIFVAALLKEKPTNSGYLPWYVTDDGVVLEHSDCKSIVIVVAFTVNWKLLSNTRRPHFLVNVMPTNGTAIPATAKGGYTRGKCIFENKPPPLSGACLLLKKGGLIFGRIWYMYDTAVPRTCVLCKYPCCGN